MPIGTYSDYTPAGSPFTFEVPVGASPAHPPENSQVYSDRLSEILLEVLTKQISGLLTGPIETFKSAATAATGTINFDVITQAALRYTTNAAANWTLNVRGSSGVSLDTLLAVDQSVTIVFSVQQGSTAYYMSALTVDGGAVVPKWAGGTAPTAGNASKEDRYTITIVKTAAATFKAYASQTAFA